MNHLIRHLARYASYHRDGRNIATHSIGIPMIIVAIEVLLSRPHWAVASLELTPAILVSAFAVLFYFTLDAGFAALLAIGFGLGCWLGSYIAAQSTETWLGMASALFSAGWALQFVGHGYEGRKPAFVDDLTSLLIGPLFLVAEACFAVGARNDVKEKIGRLKTTAAE